MSTRILVKVVGVFGQANSGSSTQGVWGSSDQGTGVYGSSNAAQSGGAGVLGRNTATNGIGVIGEANSSAAAYGVWGRSQQGIGVRGSSEQGIGIFGASNGGNSSAGVVAQGSPQGYVLRAHGFSKLDATSFEGNVTLFGDLFVSGNLRLLGELDDSKSTMLIDHPLDPSNKYLSHSSLASPDITSVYSGNEVTDASGYASVRLPDYCEALNTDFRYQLTVLDETDTNEFVQAKVVRKIEGNRFRIRSNRPKVGVSWQVTGVREDLWAKAHPLGVEKIKPENERGKYLAPELYGQPKEKGIHYRPEMPRFSRSER